MKMVSILRCRRCGAEYIYQGDYFGEQSAYSWLKEHRKTCKEENNALLAGRSTLSPF